MTLANQIVFITVSLSSYILSLRNFTKTRSEKNKSYSRRRNAFSETREELRVEKIQQHCSKQKYLDIFLLIFHSFYFLKVNE